MLGAKMHNLVHFAEEWVPKRLVWASACNNCSNAVLVAHKHCRWDERRGRVMIISLRGWSVICSPSQYQIWLPTHVRFTTWLHSGTRYITFSCVAILGWLGNQPVICRYGTREWSTWTWCVAPILRPCAVVRKYFSILTTFHTLFSSRFEDAPKHGKNEHSSVPWNTRIFGVYLILRDESLPNHHYPLKCRCLMERSLDPWAKS